MRKMIAVAAMTVALAFSGVVLAGCGGGDDAATVIKDGLTEQLEAPKTLSEDFMNQLLEQDTAGYATIMEELGVSMEEYVRAVYEGYDYSIGEVVVDGDSATVPVTVTMKDMNAFAATIEDTAANLADNPEVLSMNEEEFLSWYADEVMRILAETPVTTSDELTIELVRDSEGVWSPTPLSELMLANPLAA